MHWFLDIFYIENQMLITSKSVSNLFWLLLEHYLTTYFSPWISWHVALKPSLILLSFICTNHGRMRRIVCEVSYAKTVRQTSEPLDEGPSFKTSNSIIVSDRERTYIFRVLLAALPTLANQFLPYTYVLSHLLQSIDAFDLWFQKGAFKTRDGVYLIQPLKPNNPGLDETEPNDTRHMITNHLATISKPGSWHCGLGKHI